MPTPKGTSEIKVGQWVLLPIGQNLIKAQVLEDRGRLGIDREHVFLVLVPSEDGIEAQQREVSESRLMPAA